MTAFWRGFDRVLDALAFVAALLIPFMFLSIVYDVTTRTLRVGQISWVLGVTEYALLYVTALGAPWLLREKGHASMEAIRTVLPPRVARPVERLVLVLCTAGCLVVTVAVIPVLGQNIGVMDIRSDYLSRWMLYAAVLACFALCTVQFLRFLITGTSPYQGISANQEAL